MTSLIPQPEPQRNLPLYDGGDQPLIGFRVWRVARTPDGPRFVSLAKALIWPARRELQAECFAATVRVLPSAPIIISSSAPDSTTPPPRHRAPWPEGYCQCGIWAFHDLELPLDALWAFATGERPSAFAWAVGSVKLWGRVVEHPLGYRAEYAYPRGALIYDSNQFIEGSYEAPPLRYSQLSECAEQLTDAYGIPVASRRHNPPQPARWIPRIVIQGAAAPQVNALLDDELARQEKTSRMLGTVGVAVGLLNVAACILLGLRGFAAWRIAFSALIVVLSAATARHAFRLAAGFRELREK